MTCIVGIAEGGRVMIGGDSAGTDSGLGQTIRRDQKVFTVGEAVLGFTDSFRMGQLLRYKLKVPKRHADDDLMTYMVGDFVDAVRTCLKDGGYAAKKNEVEEGGTFLVGIAGKLFTIFGDYQVGEAVDGYDAVGCGDTLALGSLRSTYALGPAVGTVITPRMRLQLALDAAEHHSAGVRGPFVFAETTVAE